MTLETVEQEFRRMVSEQVRLQAEGVGRYRVLNPFMFDDGDHLPIVLKKWDREWVLSDEGNTYMHLTYELDEKDLLGGTRQSIIANALSAFSVSDLDGELVIQIVGNGFGDALYSFVQALLKISDVTFLSRERVRSTFIEDFESFMSEEVPEERIEFNWHDAVRDPEGNYVVDCRVNGRPRPLFVHALQNSAQAKDATITLLQFERWEVPFRSLAIFENQEEIDRKTLARLSDICEKQFSSLYGPKDRIKGYIAEALRAS